MRTSCVLICIAALYVVLVEMKPVGRVIATAYQASVQADEAYEAHLRHLDRNVRLISAGY